MRGHRWLVVRGLLTLMVVAGLAVDAYVHVDLAAGFDSVRTGTLSQGQLFRVEGAAAALAAVALLARPRRYTALFAFAVAAGGLAAVLLYRYVDVGALRPLPDMYEPFWYPKKTDSAWAEAVAALCSAALLVLLHSHPQRTPSVSHL